VPNYVTPGQYVRHLRQVAGMEPLDLALSIDAVPPLPTRSRVLLIEAVEADLVPLHAQDAAALAAIPWLALDRAELAAVIEGFDRLRGGAIRIIRAPTLAERRIVDRGVVRAGAAQ
jgi:hypothetical protein